MWGIARALVTAIFGDEIVKYVLYAVAGVFVFVMLQGGGFLVVLFGQPWGAWSMGGPGGGSPVVQAPQAAVAQVAVPTLAPLQLAPVANASRVGQMIAAAMTWLGTRYQWGGCSHSGIDCSCFVQNVLAAVGISAPRTTTTQVRWARPVSRAELQPGDLLFFNNTCDDCGANPTHVAIFMGDGRQIHCGSPCQISPVDWAHYASAGRPIGL